MRGGVASYLRSYSGAAWPAGQVGQSPHGLWPVTVKNLFLEFFCDSEKNIFLSIFFAEKIIINKKNEKGARVNVTQVAYPSTKNGLSIVSSQKQSLLKGAVRKKVACPVNDKVSCLRKSGLFL